MTSGCTPTLVNKTNESIRCTNIRWKSRRQRFKGLAPLSSLSAERAGGTEGVAGDGARRKRCREGRKPGSTIERGPRGGGSTMFPGFGKGLRSAPSLRFWGQAALGERTCAFHRPPPRATTDASRLNGGPPPRCWTPGSAGPAVEGPSSRARPLSGSSDTKSSHPSAEGPQGGWPTPPGPDPPSPPSRNLTSDSEKGGCSPNPGGPRGRAPSAPNAIHSRPLRRGGSPPRDGGGKQETGTGTRGVRVPGGIPLLPTFSGPPSLNAPSLDPIRNT